MQVKVKLSPPPEESTLTRTSSKRLSFQRRNRLKKSTPVTDDAEVIEKYVITFKGSNANVNGVMSFLRLALFSLSATGEAPIQLSGGVDSPAKSVFDPYDTTSLQIFIRETFPDSLLLERYQVSAVYNTSVYKLVIQYFSYYISAMTILIGCCNLPAFKYQYLLVIRLPTNRKQQETPGNCRLFCQPNNT